MKPLATRKGLIDKDVLNICIIFIMLLIETRSEREQQILEEDFCRQNDHFAVPKQKISLIEDFLEAIIFEMFYRHDDTDYSDFNNKKQVVDKKLKTLPLLQKIKVLVTDALRMTVSLTTVRQVFEYVRKFNEEAQEYQKYLFSMDQIIDGESQHHIFGSLDNESFEDIVKICDQSLYPKNAVMHTLQGDMSYSLNSGNLSNLLQSKRLQSRKNQPSNLQSIQKQNELGVGQISERSSHQKKYSRNSLHLQIKAIPKVDCLHDMFNAKLHESISSDDLEQSTSMLQVKQQIPYDRSTTSTLYCPPWKQKQDEQKKKLEQKMGKEADTKNREKCQKQFLNNLSGKFNPSPSILNDQSFGKMERRQAKEEIKKSVMIKSSVFGEILGSLESGVPETSEKMYNYNLKNMKLQKKLKIGSKISPTNKNSKIQRKLSNEQEGSSYEVGKTESQMSSEQMKRKEQKSGGILSNIFRFKKQKQSKFEREKEKKILACVIE